MAGISNAFALEAQEVGERLKALLARQHVDLSYEEASLDGDDVQLSGVQVKPTAGGGQPLDLGTITLQDVTEEDDGSFRIGAFDLDSFEHRESDVTVSMTDLSVTGMVLPRDEDSDPFGGAIRYDRMEVARVDVEGKDGPLASLNDLYVNINIDDDNRMEMDGAAESFSLNLAALVESGNGAAALEELGYTELSGSAFMEGSWQPSDGRMTLSRYEMNVDDAGTLSMSLDLAGYTPAFIRALEDMAKQMEQQSGSESETAQGMAMLGLMQQLTLHGASVRFTDDSFTAKALDHVAKQQGRTPAELIAMAKTTIPAQISPFVGADFAAEVAEAVGTFLESPGYIEVSAKPGNPLPFAMLAAAALASPEVLVNQIGLSIRANE